MKTKCVVAAVALAFAMLSATAKAPKHYSNSAGGYSGWAGAEYRGATETYDLSYYDTGDFIYDVVEGDVKKKFRRARVCHNKATFENVQRGRVPHLESPRRV